MDRKKLESLRALRQELNTLEHKYMKMPHHEEVADTYGDYSIGMKRTKIIRGQSNYRSQKLAERISAKSKKIEREVLELEEYLDNLDDSEMRDILRLYFAEGLTQEEIGRRKGYSRSAIGDKIEKFFEKEKSGTNGKKSVS